MLSKVTIAYDHTDPETWVAFETEDVFQTLQEQFPEWPKNAKIYHGTAAIENDVTPHDLASCERFSKLTGEFVVILFPGAFIVPFLPYIFAAVLAVAAYLLAPSVKPIPVIAQRNSNASSPNNELSNRTNRARINGRIPDIFGTVFSTPDLITATYSIYENNREVEYAYMCIGRGEYEILEPSVKDGATRCSKINGCSVAIYPPYNSPNSVTPAPQLQIGSSIHHKVLNTKKSNSINGQVLRPPNSASITTGMRFVWPNKIQSGGDFSQKFVEGDQVTLSDAILASGGAITVTENLSSSVVYSAGTPINKGLILVVTIPGGAGDSLFNPNYVTGAMVTIADLSSTLPGYSTATDLTGEYEIDSVEYGSIGGEYNLPMVFIWLVSPELVNADWLDIATGGVVNPDKYLEMTIINTTLNFNLNGNYTIVSVTSNEIVLDDPISVAADWANLEADGVSPNITATLATTESLKWYGPVILETLDRTSILSSFVAVNGLYKDNGTTQFEASVTVQLEVTPVDSADAPIGDPQYFLLELVGSDSLKESVGKTLTAVTNAVGRVSVRAARITESDTAFSGTVVDEVRWKDLYSVSPVDYEDFGNVTTAQTVTFATASALAVKDRKFNLVATRKVPTRIGSTSTFTTTLTASQNAADIFCAICLDTYIGRRRLAELDVTNIYDTLAAVETYFGHVCARQFNATFDQDNFSFEETANAVADAVFCIAYRRGNLIKLNFEKATEDSTLLFNHRNKLPNSETRAVSFGLQNDYDGVQYQYASPLDGSIVTVFLPEGYASVNPQKVESIGVQHHLLAYFHIWRIWNRLQYQREGVQFDATDEANLLIKNDRILVSDGTRPYSQEGEVLAINTLTLTLSQPVDFTVYSTYSIWLQHYDGVAENIAITAGANSNQVVLADAPRLSLVTDSNKYARTTYIVVGEDQPHSMAFLLTERMPSEKMTSTVKAVNYAAEYYANDTDYINELIDENGYSDEGGFEPGTGTGFLVLPSAPVLSSEEAGDVVTLDWTSSTVGTWPIIGYRVYQDSVLVATVTTGLTWDSNELDDGTYDFRVTAVDSKGNESAESNVEEVVILDTPDPIGLFVSSWGNNTIQTSPPGTIAWTNRYAFPLGRLHHAVEAGIIFCVTPDTQDGREDNGDNLARSTDGINWSSSVIIAGVSSTTVRRSAFHGIAYSPLLDRTIAVGQVKVWDAESPFSTLGVGFTSARSDDGGVIWTEEQLETPSGSFSISELIDVCWVQTLELFIAVGFRLAGGVYSAHLFTTPDGETWTERTLPTEFTSTANIMTGVVFNVATGEVFVCGNTNVGNDTAFKMAKSSDGVTWNIVSLSGHSNKLKGRLFYFHGVATYGNILVAAAGSGKPTAAFYRSTDGAAWTSITITEWGKSMAYDPATPKFVAIQWHNTGGYIHSKATPTSGSWTISDSDADQQRDSVIWAV